MTITRSPGRIPSRRSTCARRHADLSWSRFVYRRPSKARETYSPYCCRLSAASVVNDIARPLRSMPLEFQRLPLVERSDLTQCEIQLYSDAALRYREVVRRGGQRQ